MARGWLRTAKAVYVAAVALALGWALFEVRGVLQNWPAWVGSPGVYAFVAGWCAMAFLLGLGWARVVRGYLGVDLAVRDWLPIQSIAWAGRYLPGKIGLLAGKLPLLERDGVGWRSLGFSVLYEQLAFLVVGSAVVLVSPLPFQWLLLPIAVTAPEGLWLRIAVAGSIVAAFLFASQHLARQAEVPRRPDGKDISVMIAIYVLAHVTVGIGFHLFILAFVEPAHAPVVAYSIGLLAAANIAGILALFAPAGIGVRDGVLALGLSPLMPLQEALGLAALLRILTLVADLVFIAAGGGLARMPPLPRHAA